jgi:Txe/YoeB family toxin of Txe-Axe toxin-antitoxin module
MQNKIKPLKPEIVAYLKQHQLEKKFDKAKQLFESDIQHPSLNVKVLEPKSLKIYSFRVDLKYRALFFIVDEEVEIISVTNHYK